MAKICVFAASSKPQNLTLKHSIAQIATIMASQGHHLIMGGVSNGCMGVFGQTFLNAGGHATIIYPEEFAEYESLSHPNLIHIKTPNLHQRLERMIDMADAFIAFPGGIGTIHEVAQVIADNQAALYHSNGQRKVKPLVMFSPPDCNFFKGLIDFYRTAKKHGYINQHHFTTLINNFTNTPNFLIDDLLNRLE